MSSTYQRPRYGVGSGRMQLERVKFPPVSAAVNSAFTLIEIADAANLKRGQEAQVPAVLLTDPNNATWRVTIDSNGVLQTAKIEPP